MNENVSKNITLLISFLQINKIQNNNIQQISIQGKTVLPHYFFSTFVW